MTCCPTKLWPLCCVLWIAPLGAEAQTRFTTFSFTGTVESVFDGLGALDSSIIAGATFEGSYRFDPSTPNTAPPVPSGEAGLYKQDRAPAGVTMSVGNLNVRTARQPVVFDIIVNNDIGPEQADQYGFDSPNNDWTGVVGSASVEQVDLHWLASTTTGNPFDSAALPTTPPDLALLGGGVLSLEGRCTTCFGENAFFRLQGTLTSLELTEGLLGDFNRNGVLDAPDIDLLTATVIAGSNDLEFDLNNDELVNQQDRTIWVHDLRKTWFGDATLDGLFNSDDLILALSSGEYEDGIASNSIWESGDWNGDGDFTSADLIEAISDGGYDAGPRPMGPAAVPEPSAALSMTMGLLLLAMRSSRRAG
jgi:hypothetical protein